MSVPPESIAVGKCYLTLDRRLRRVTEIRPDGEVRYKYRSFPPTTRRIWKSGNLQIHIFAATTLREVPFGWTPATDETAG